MAAEITGCAARGLRVMPPFDDAGSEVSSDDLRIRVWRRWWDIYFSDPPYSPQSGVMYIISIKARHL
ncbi:hypothetical protein TNCV_2543011 [Trichonephila clavipes]|nr:hypothetical protein TNCV_2543011 [Trichonephila clavipes]